MLFAATAVTGERKAVAVLGFGGNGGAVAAALLYHGSPLPCRASNAELLPPSSSTSTHRTAPVSDRNTKLILLFGVILVSVVCIVD